MGRRRRRASPTLLDPSAAEKTLPSCSDYSNPKPHHNTPRKKQKTDTDPRERMSTRKKKTKQKTKGSKGVSTFAKKPFVSPSLSNESESNNNNLKINNSKFNNESGKPNGSKKVLPKPKKLATPKK